MACPNNYALAAAHKIKATFPGNKRFWISSPSEMEALVTVSLDIKSRIGWHFNYPEFHEALCSVLDLSLECLWCLHVYQILPIETYLSRLSEQNFGDFKLYLNELLFMDSTKDISVEFVQIGMSSYFVNKSVSGSGYLLQISQSVINSILKAIFSMNKEELTAERTKTFCSLWSCKTLEKQNLNQFCINSLKQFLQDEEVSVHDAFAVQENCFTKDEPFHMLSVTGKMIHFLGAEPVGHFLSEFLVLSTLNWKNFIVLLDQYLQIHKRALLVISGIADEFLKRSLLNANHENLQKAFLFWRQTVISQSTPQSYPLAYKQWFIAHFGSCQQLKNKQSFSSFIQALTGFIPYENNVSILKISLEPLFAVPVDCQSNYSYYIALLKTRINDLEPSIKPNDVIEKVLTAFEECGKIPSYIMEASLMRKHFFLKEFLPVLLTPRQVPTLPDLKEKFITQLERAGKISGPMLQNYRSACLQEQKRTKLQG